MAVREATLPAYRHVPEYALTNGDVAAEVGAMIGLTPDPNQQDILDAMFAEERPGRLACFEVGICGPRQNIKSSTLEVATLTDLIVFREPLQMWTAHLTKTMRGAFSDMRDRIDSRDELRRRFKKPREANGQECLELLTGEKIEFYSRSKGGGRGRTARKVVMDEALILDAPAVGALLPTMATVLNAQVRYGSSAGLSTSEVWRGVRDRGRAGSSPRLAWFEWCAPPKDCQDPKCVHAPGTGGCAYDDEDLWVPANPALGDRISLETLRDLRAGLPPEEWAREFLGWWDDPSSGSVISSALWSSIADRSALPPRPVGKVAFAIDTSPDRIYTSIAVAGERPDGLLQVQVVERKPGTDWVIDRISDLVATYDTCAVVVDRASAAASLLVELERLQPVVTGANDLVEACGQFYDAAVQGRLRHLDQEILNVAVQNAEKRDLEAAWAWRRKNTTVDITPLVSSTLALWGWTTRHASGDILQNVW